MLEGRPAPPPSTGGGLGSGLLLRILPLCDGYRRRRRPPAVGMQFLCTRTAVPLAATRCVCC